MRNGKMKTLQGLYRVLGRDVFLAVARNYSDNVRDCIDQTLDEMESRWFDDAQTMTEAEKMVSDYNRGMLVGYDVAVFPAAENTMSMGVMM